MAATKSLRVGVDLDGVCFNFADSLRRYLIDAGIKTEDEIGPGETPCWNFYEGWGFTLDEFKTHCNNGVDLGYVFRGPTREGAPEAIQRIKALGHTIHIITDRQFGSDPINSQIATKEWLEEHRIPYDTLTFSADKTCVPTDIFVEDKLENYDALKAAGVDCYLIDRPWNHDPAEAKGHPSMIRKRIKSITDFADVIEAELVRVF